QARRLPHVEAADVAHAVPEGLSVADFVERVGFGACNVFGGDDASANDEFADFTGRQLLGFGECGDGLVGDAGDLPFDARKVAADDVPQRGRTESLGHFPVVDGFDDFFWIDASRARGIHVGNDGGHAHGAVEEGEQRKAGQVDFARLDVVKVAEFIDLCVEVG